MTTEIITVNNNVVINNKELKKVTNQIEKLGARVQNDMLRIAYLLADVDSRKLYEDDFANTIEYATSVFGFKKSLAYSLIKIGGSMVERIGSGVNTRYISNIVHAAPNDYTVSQLTAILPVDRDTVDEWATTGELNSNMSVREIKSKVKEYRNRFDEDTDEEETEPDKVEETDETAETAETEVLVEVWDKNGKRYLIPLDVLTQYMKGGD